MKSNVYKGGRCFNGAHRDAGTIVHIIQGEEPNGYWGGKALCGAEPGRRSYGWSKTEKETNCQKCIKRSLKMKKIFCLIENQWTSGDVAVLALCEDGHVVGTHLSSSIGWAKRDIGFTDSTAPKHEQYKAHCPDGYELIWVTDEELAAQYEAKEGEWYSAYMLNQAMKETEPAKSEVNE
jgi:hypothetical protein